MLGGPSDPTTGLPDLDRVIHGLLPGDNVVWQVDDPGDYAQFAAPFCEAAAAQGRRIVYFRFAAHPPLLTPEEGVRVQSLDPGAGFETFVGQVRETIREMGHGGSYVFDCLSDLALTWLSDQMLGSFFLLTCPYLLDMGAVAYFGLLRNRHALQATSLIAGTTQLLLNVVRYDGRVYLYPVKVQQRYSPTMHTLHLWEDGEFRTVTDSDVIARVQSASPWVQLGAMEFEVGLWNHSFVEATEALEADRRADAGASGLQAATRGPAPPPSIRTDGRLKYQLLRMAVSRDERMLGLLDRYLGLDDLLAIRRRMIGTGLIGGKAVGMILARAILRAADPQWGAVLEPHDSFYVGSDVFYTYLVTNGVWWVREKQRSAESFLDGAETARQRLLTGSLPDHTEASLRQMLDYFGQWPIITRSSSLLEDNFGNAFAGKYESIFCVNQGPGDQRLRDLESAVRAIYASSMSERALVYRAQRGLLDRDEQMALLVQRVSGRIRGGLFMPDAAGVGLSLNPYVWHREIDPQAGVLRLVAGLGTRAVDRTDDDFSRVVALSAPQRRLESSPEQVRRYSQRRIDCLDLEANRPLTLALPVVRDRAPGFPLHELGTVDAELGERLATDGGSAACPWVLTFEPLLTQTHFAADMRRMLQTLSEAYEYPVDVEFTANLRDDGGYRVNLVQCRPLQIRGAGPDTRLPRDMASERVIAESAGPIIGQGLDVFLDRVVLIRPQAYSKLPLTQRHGVARLVAGLAGAGLRGVGRLVLLMGPGRWGTSTPSLGVPVRFSDISAASIVCEIASMGDHAAPDISLGTHFLNELIEADMLYMAVSPGRPGNRLHEALVERLANSLGRLLPDAAEWAHVVHVLDVEDLPAGMRIRFTANTPEQRAVCYLTEAG